MRAKRIGIFGIILSVLLVCLFSSGLSAKSNTLQIPDYSTIIIENSPYIYYDTSTERLYFSILMVTPQSFMIRITSVETVSFCLFGVAFDNTLGEKYVDDPPFQFTYNVNSTDEPQSIGVKIFWQSGEQAVWQLDCLLDTDAPTIPTTPATEDSIDTTEDNDVPVTVVVHNHNTVVVRLWWLAPLLAIPLYVIVLFFLRKLRVEKEVTVDE